MPTILRFILKPKVLMRFLKGKAGRKALFGAGRMLLNSKMTQNLIDKFMNKNDDKLKQDKNYPEMQKQYQELQSRVQELEAKLQKNQENTDSVQAVAFSIGRNVVEMRNLYAQMQADLQRIAQNQMVTMAAAQNAR